MLFYYIPMPILDAPVSEYAKGYNKQEASTLQLSKSCYLHATTYH